MSPYREAGPGAPSDDPHVVVPGKGLRGIWVGRATVDDVIREFGDDCEIYKQADGDVTSVDYTWGPGRDLPVDRPGHRERPAKFQFEFGLLDEIHVNGYQDDLYTPEGIRIGLTRAEVQRILGEGELLEHPTIDTLRYPQLGIALRIHHSSGNVGSFVIFRAKR